MLEEVYFYKPEAEASTTDMHQDANTLYFDQFYAKNFAQFMGYVTIIALLLLIVSIGLHSVFEAQIIIESVGILSNLIDCIVTLPQFILVVINKEIRYVTIPLLCQWILALGCKLGLYIYRPVPLPFMLGLAIQAVLTFFIVTFYIYIRLSHCNSDPAEEEQAADNVAPDYKVDFQQVSSETATEA
ncbi:hypothetical protein TVAG_257650 [Trichomonas vaginalis G3]|uniref:PQ loop repeat family protein n=1 Tax=Trichomonas vaginalis (strain ATCC PRA-98 / G3) TaxID=412133 RepID=A2F4E6_TRIV3|nr:PQ-loop repeat-containing protein 1-like protein family [Trichomonas vaginalis G3]EAY00211.1 hypothetical protein TVAG_257650 [Trichomonas vaginalis G3]KAI5492899.1 PQ-loop repeat-containing protein 1-like protein family [Trichomonas vaginalis G3]|eukprot:XP_001313140.1 hypothetical protein [Trichomonas vaginalis G3]